MSVIPLEIITNNISEDMIVLPSPTSSACSSFYDRVNRRETFSPDFDVVDIETRKQLLTKRLTEELTTKLTYKLTQELTYKLTEELTYKLTEELTHKLTEELTHKITEELTHKLTEELKNKVCNMLEEHMTHTLSNINIKYQPKHKKCCIIS
jgi:signal recognition particle GTPase